MTRRTLPREGRPRTSPDEAEQIETAARRRRAQMLPGAGPHAADKDVPVDHFKGGDETIRLGPDFETASYTKPHVPDAPSATPDDSKPAATGKDSTPSSD